MVYYVVMRLQRWDGMEIAPISAFHNLPLEFKGMGIGFLPVFSSREEAQAAFPEAIILEIQEAPDGL